MGVTGLHPQLKEIQTPKSLEQYRGKTLAVDTYGWLHKATVSCAQELCLNKPTQKYISSVLKKVDMLRHFGVEPYLVFDGASLPTKAATADERRLRREEAQRKADELVKSGNGKLAWKEFMKAAAVTCQMAKSVMVELDKLGVKYVVAPYEADPQMVYLEKIGLVDGILSEDSDLLIFGCKRLISKLNDFGECVEICTDDFKAVKTIKNLQDFTPLQLRLVAMLSGCDYTKGIPGVGLKTAFNLINKYGTTERVLQALRADGKKIPDTFQDEMIKADLAFQFQKVYDPRCHKLVTLNEYPEIFDYDMEMVEECCGISFDDATHTGVCTGKLHPNTHENLVAREQSIESLKSKSFTAGVTNKRESTGLTNKRHMLAPRGQIDSFFKSKSTTERVNQNRTITNTTTVYKTSVPMSEKLLPLNKKTKKFIDVTQETPKLGAFSKYFKSMPTLQSTDPDISGSSDIPEFSSPVKTDTNKVLESIEPSTDKASSKLHSTSDFEFSDSDDEIEDSPVKTNQSPAKIKAPVSTNNKENLRKLLREKFLFDPKATKTVTSESLPTPPVLQRISDSSFTQAESLDSESSIDLKSDDIKTDGSDFVDQIFVDANKSFDDIKKKGMKYSSLAKFAFKPT